MVGGEYRRLTESLVGPLALDAISRYNVRLAFVGTDGLSVERGMTTHLAEGAEIVKAMVARAEHSVLLADSSKYGRSGFVSVLPLSGVDIVIMDDGLAPRPRTNSGPHPSISDWYKGEYSVAKARNHAPPGQHRGILRARGLARQGRRKLSRPADILCDVETDKAVFEVPAGFDGIVLKLLVAEGDDVPVLAPIAVIGEPGRTGSPWRPGTDAVSLAAVSRQPPALAPSRGQRSRRHRPASCPASASACPCGSLARARELAFHEAVNPPAWRVTARAAGCCERDVRAAVEARAALGRRPGRGGR